MHTFFLIWCLIKANFTLLVCFLKHFLPNYFVGNVKHHIFASKSKNKYNLKA